MVIDKPFTLILEGPIDNGDGEKRNNRKRLECGCVIALDTEGKPKLLVKSVDDVTHAGADGKGRRPIGDEQDLPDIRQVIEAAKLQEWSEEHEAVFQGLTVRDPANTR